MLSILLCSPGRHCQDLEPDRPWLEFQAWEPSASCVVSGASPYPSPLAEAEDSRAAWCCQRERRAASPGRFLVLEMPVMLERRRSLCPMRGRMRACGWVRLTERRCAGCRSTRICHGFPSTFFTTPREQTPSHAIKRGRICNIRIPSHPPQLIAPHPPHYEDEVHPHDRSRRPRRPCECLGHHPALGNTSLPGDRCLYARPSYCMLSRPTERLLMQHASPPRASPGPRPAAVRRGACRRAQASKASSCVASPPPRKIQLIPVQSGTVDGAITLKGACGCALQITGYALSPHRRPQTLVLKQCFRQRDRGRARERDVLALQRLQVRLPPQHRARQLRPQYAAPFCLHLPRNAWSGWADAAVVRQLHEDWGPWGRLPAVAGRVGEHLLRESAREVERAAFFYTYCVIGDMCRTRGRIGMLPTIEQLRGSRAKGRQRCITVESKFACTR